jgi:hypothetical protein
VVFRPFEAMRTILPLSPRVRNASPQGTSTPVATVPTTTGTGRDADRVSTDAAEIGNGEKTREAGAEARSRARASLTFIEMGSTKAITTGNDLFMLISALRQSLGQVTRAAPARPLSANPRQPDQAYA